MGYLVGGHPGLAVRLVQAVKVAIVGSRKGADVDDVRKFLSALYQSDPLAVVVSGGAVGVDKRAELEWLRLGGRVISLRPKQEDDSWWVEQWFLSREGNLGHVHTLRDVSFADFTSAAVYRDLLISQECDRLVAFQSDPPSSGTAITCGFAREQGKPVYVYTPKARFCVSAS